ncbi:Gfo/Idh/MocA family protein [Chthonobacter rhizosphaerae]|uniref:Gfo/Idh/MocA family protein n=1 Tax=Chthonobacter rhizosphaerae TaxID=2735553 RepID=UPI0015EEFAF2|nr:Gfo/Idh/MocA family oxidoreductase [Chthonobacter rhizosphaerae]
MVKVIQVGLGHWGYDWASSVLPTVETIDMVGYVDGVAEARDRIETMLGVERSRLFASLDQALAATDADLVLATLRTEAHYPVVKQALLAGKHVIVEKPFTTTIDEARELVDLAASRGLVLMVSQNYRHYPAPILAADLIERQALGHVSLVGIEFRQHAPTIGYRYWDFPDPLLADMSIHHFDLMRMVLKDEPHAVSCRTWNLPGSPFHNHPVGVATVEFAGGTIVSYRGSWMSGGAATAWAGEWTFDCADGEIWFTSRGHGDERFERDVVVLRSREKPAEEPALPTVRHFDRAGTIAACAEAIRTGTLPPRFSSGADNIRSLALMQASILSTQRGGDWVRIDEVLPDAAGP